MKTNLTGGFSLSEVAEDGFADVGFQFAKVFALGGDTATAVGRVPMGNEPAGVFVALDRQCDLFHGKNATADVS